MAAWIEKKPIGDARIQEDGTASHSLHFRSDAGEGITESVTQGYIFGDSAIFNGVTLYLTGKRTAQDGVMEDVFLEYTLPGTDKGKKMSPVGTIEISAEGEVRDIDVGEAAASTDPVIAALGNDAIARGEQTVGVPHIALTVKDTKAFTWSESSIISAAAAATPAAYIGTCTSSKWSPSSISIRSSGSRAEIVSKWYFFAG